jgi:hypothetical protein
MTLRAFAMSFWQVDNQNTTFVVGEGEPHDGAIFAGIKVDTGRAIDAWDNCPPVRRVGQNSAPGPV